MTAQQLTDSTYTALCSLPFTRKPNFFSEAPSVGFSDLSSDIQDAINTFPVIYIDPKKDLMGVDTLDGNQQFYVVRNEDGEFLIDTQGYNYPRYILELIGLQEEQEEDYDRDAFEHMEGMIRTSDSNIFDSVIRSMFIELVAEGVDSVDAHSFLQLKFDMVIKEITK